MLSLPTGGDAVLCRLLLLCNGPSALAGAWVLVSARDGAKRIEVQRLDLQDFH